MTKLTSWMWRCEASVAAYHVEWTAMLHQPPLDFVDLTPSDSDRKRLSIGHQSRPMIHVVCLPLHDTCVEAYLVEPIQPEDRELVMGFLNQLNDRAISLKLVRRPIGFGTTVR